MSFPNILRTGFKIDEPKLWAINLPIEEIDISLLDHNKDILYLESEGTDDRNLSPRMLIENFEKEHRHAGAVSRADTSYPIEIYENNGVRIILDGVHRYTKLLMKGATTIKVRKISREVALLCARS